MLHALCLWRKSHAKNTHSPPPPKKTPYSSHFLLQPPCSMSLSWNILQWSCERMGTYLWLDRATECLLKLEKDQKCSLMFPAFLGGEDLIYLVRLSRFSRRFSQPRTICLYGPDPVDILRSWKKNTVLVTKGKMGECVPNQIRDWASAEHHSPPPNTRIHISRCCEEKFRMIETSSHFISHSSKFSLRDMEECTLHLSPFNWAIHCLT